MKQRLITIAAGLIALTAAVVWVGQGAAPSRPAAATPEAITAPSPAPDASSVDEHAKSAAPRRVGSRDLVSYAIPITEMQGLPPDIAPGTMIDLWVMWQPPVTKRPKVDRLLQGVLLEKIVPPLLPDGPYAAVLMVSPDDFGTLVWGDRLGALSAAVPAASES